MLPIDRASDRPGIAARSVRRSLAMAAIAALLTSAGGVAAATARPAATPPDGPSGATGYLEGIDVSHWQNAIDWTKVKASGKSFAIIKATEGTTFVDSRYAINRAAAKAAGVPTTAYHFAQPGTGPNDAIDEADHFVDTARLGAGDIVPALDLEVANGLSQSALTTWVRTWLDRVDARLDVKAMVYTSPAFWKKYLGDTTSIANAGYDVLWIAHWGASAPSVAASNWGGHGWSFWQYSNCGTVPGIGGCVDLDRFNGTNLGSVTYDPGFRISAEPTGLSIKQEASGTLDVAVSRVNFDDVVSFEIQGLPAGVTGSFSPAATAGGEATLELEVTAAAEMGTYAVTVVATGGGLTRVAPFDLVVADGIGPVASAPRGRLTTGPIGSSSPLRTLWSATDPSGVSSYRVQRRVGGGSWTDVAASTTATSITESLVLGSTVGYRVRATDTHANVGEWQVGPTLQALLVEETSPGVTFAGQWQTDASPGASGGSQAHASAAGATARYSFEGASIAWVAAKGPDRGVADVLIDGSHVATVNLDAASLAPRRIVFAVSWPSSGHHTIAVVVKDASGASRVDVDAFVRLRALEHRTASVGR